MSDGQLLFMQHILWKLAGGGIAVEVHNGSTLFSGDAGSGESNIRKYIFDHDWVEAIIQMPQNEFFNTGIYTYLWIMNKEKPFERKNKVALIDGSNLWKPLKKSKGDKRREMTSEHREAIVKALTDFVPSDICKIFDREHFYYNKQSLTLTEISEEGRYVEQTVCPDGKAFAIKKPVSLTIGEDVYDDLSSLTPDDIKAIAKRVTSERQELAVSVKTEDDGVYAFLPERCTIIHTDKDGKEHDLGCGAFSFKTSVNKKKIVVHKIAIEPFLTSDYEIIPHHMDEHENQCEVEAFMQRYLFKPYVLGKNVVGVELNFNKEFYVPEKIDNVNDVMEEIRSLNNELMGIIL